MVNLAERGATMPNIRYILIATDRHGNASERPGALAPPCGPKGRHQGERAAWRGGSVDSQVTLRGRQGELPRLRVRSANGEVPLVGPAGGLH